MPNQAVVSWIHEKYKAIVTELDERGRRRWAAIEASSLGWGGVAAVALATGISNRTIRNGIRELESSEYLESNRQRRPGGGRHSREEEQRRPLETLEIVVNLIGSTKTNEGLEVHAWIDRKKYEKGLKITDTELQEVHLQRNKFHGDWNYEIHPRL